MIDDSAINPTGETIRNAIRQPLGERRMIDAIVRDPDRLEPGWTILARDAELGEGILLPLLALDASGRPVVVVVGEDDPANLLVEGMSRASLLRQQLPLLRKVVATVARPHVGPVDSDEPRLVLLAPRFPDEIREMVDMTKGIRISLFEYRFFRIGDTFALQVEPPGSHAAPAPAAEVASTADEHCARLLSDARARILNLSPEITALGIGEGLSFRYRGRDLARFEREGSGWSLVTPREPKGRRILGRSDLEAGLHGVIEEFFALYAAGAEPSRGGIDVPRPREHDSPDAAPAATAEPRPTATQELRTSPLTREEIEEFLRPDDES